MAGSDIPDRCIDESGRIELAHIVALADSYRLGALQQIANLARRYPDSPHVQLTRALLEADRTLREAHGSVRLLRERFETIVDLDPGYLLSHHWLCSARLASCCAWEVLEREGREHFVAVHLDPMMRALADHRLDSLGDYVLSHQGELLVDNWRTATDAAVKAFALAVSHADSSRFSPAQLERFTRTANALVAGTDVIRARATLTRWLELWLPRVREGYPPESWAARYA